MANEVKKIIPTEEQTKAVEYCLNYINNKVSDNGKGYIFISGQAGVGKSEIQKFILQHFKPTEFRLAAYTVEAARVMEEKSGYEASTIHRLMYQPLVDDDGNIVDWLYCPDELKDNKEIKFVIIDECSMMTEKQLNDLKKCGKKIIVFGDYYQLPPINAPQIFSKENADIILTKIHRQAEGNPLIQYLTKLRNGIDMPFTNIDDKLIKTNIEDLLCDDGKPLLEFDQIICGMNRTKNNFNELVRAINGYTSIIPQEGDKLIFTKNNYNVGVANGDQFRVLKDVKFYDEYNGTFVIYGNIIGAGKNCKPRGYTSISDNYDNIKRNRIPYYDVKKYYKSKWSKKPLNVYKKIYVETEFSYAISCHKSQGSEWGKILIIDESDVFRDFKYRWLYTAVSRGKESVTIVKS